MTAFILLNTIIQQQHTCEIPQVESVEGGLYAALTLPYKGREAIFDRPLAQVKHIKQVGKENTVKNTSSSNNQ